MKIIKEIVHSIKEEIHLAEDYAKMATKWKAEDRSLADTFDKMARQKLENINLLHTHVVRIINSYKQQGGEVPTAMQAVWDYEHENMIEWIARINVLIGMYSKP